MKNVQNVENPEKNVTVTFDKKGTMTGADIGTSIKISSISLPENVTPTIHKAIVKDYWKREVALKMIKYEFESHYMRRGMQEKFDEVFRK